MIKKIANILLVLFLFSSCITANKVKRWAVDNEVQLAEICSERFPVEVITDTVVTQDLELLNAYEQEFAVMANYIDSLLMENCDTVFTDKVVERIKQVTKAKPPKVITVTNTVENTAKIVVLRDSVKQMEKKVILLEAKNKDLQAKVDKRTSQRNYLFVGLLMLVLWLFRTPILKLLKHL